uniref:SCAN box domain-containing protein n=1 Tax=Oryzias latipes TaxID=8090 RepID=A0A3B3IM63_ORYLA
IGGPRGQQGRTDVYRAVRGVLRERRHNSPVTCCRRLRLAEVPSGRRPAGACGQRKGLSRGWEQLERRTEERIGGVAVVEQPQPVHPSDARTWVEEHVPEDSPADACRPTGRCPVTCDATSSHKHLMLGTHQPRNVGSSVHYQ